ncbi:c-type cytochrome [Sedimenticola sp.]|uniref:c-type cytochrome n=1 Tax=Sedimenticola sp. TaxID=1940285 RepID=UPI002588F8C2|nr:c-type cytochrome [Sedimenticola sp.]MCW8903902.1 c-type cytochrome [Sedimenticola sp.]
MKTIAMFAGAALLSLGLAGNAAAADGAALYASKGCAACHGADAKTPIMPAYPKLAGQNAQYALNQMKDIKSGARNNGQTAAMKGIVMSVSEEELQAIAEWLAAQ